MAFREIENLMPMKEPTDKTGMFRTLLKGKVLSYFEHHIMRRLEEEDSEVPDNELIELVLRDVGLEYIPKHAIRMPKYHVRQPWGLYMDLNTYLEYSSDIKPNQLDQDEIIEILDQSKAWDPEWYEAMVNTNIDIFGISYEESVSYFKCLENLEKIRRTNGPNLSSLPVDEKNMYICYHYCRQVF
jgi:hypothetical protein